MTIDTTTAPANSTAPGVGRLNDDAFGRDAFLSLLITKLQHQDPTQPQADGEFLAQLAQFTTLEQLQQINKTLATIASYFPPSPTSSTTATEGR